MTTVCILTKNVAATLEKTLNSTRPFSEVLLLDNGSTDETLAIAKNFSNVRIFNSPFIGFGPLRNRAAELASSDWILALDSDEVLSPPLFEELQSLKRDPKMVYRFPRHNFYNEKRILGCGWGKEQVARFYNRKFTQFSSSQVHEKLESALSIALKSPILHTPYRSTSDFLIKMEHYSTLFAKEHRGKKRASFPIAIAHASFAFIRSYLIKGGIFGGKEGFLISLYNANTALYKYLKLAELNKLR